MIRRIIDSFNASGLDYAFTGALAASYYGIPRTTMDVDVVVKISFADLQTELVPALRKAGLKVEEERIIMSLKSGFKIATFKDNKSPFTVDVIFSDKKLRKRAGIMLGLSTFFQAPEELVSAKLRMIKATIPRERAQKDENDVKAILKFTKANVDAVRKQAQKDSTLQILEDILAKTANQD